MGKKDSKKNDDDQVIVDDEEDDTRCGLGPCCNGSFMQKFANKKAYLLTYSFLGLFQSMFFSYSIATLTSLEKEFGLKSQTTGILLSGNECSQILLSLVMTYFGGNGHRPRLAAIGVVFSGIASLLVVVPHFVYGRSGIVINGTRNMDTCHVSDNYFLPTMSPADCIDHSQPIAPMIYIFMSQFVSGIGTTLFSILGITYLDDNVKRKQTPFLVGIMSALRLIGPALGFVLAGVFLRTYVNLSEKTTLKSTDPAWIGAWWLGFLVIGIAQLSTFWMLALFPRRLPKISKTLIRGNSTISTTSSMSAYKKPKERTLKEFPAALKRLLTNKILILNNLAGVFFVFSLSGYLTFLPKYMETQFQQSASRSGAVNGGISVGFMCTGLLFFGYLISRFRPSAVKLQIWDVCFGIIWAALLIAFAFVSCDAKPISGLEQYDLPDPPPPLVGMPPVSCNEECNCQANRFAPVCSEDGRMNFFSGCHAGCKNFTFVNGKSMFSDCSCIQEWKNTTDYPNEPPGPGSWQNGNATGGYCASNCFEIFLIYVLTMGVAKFFSTAGRVGNILIGFRCVPPEDKSFAIGLGYLFVSLFAFIPAPIVYGAVIDKACILWRTDACGVKGNCWIYDSTKMRQYLHLLSAGFVFLGVVADFFGIFAVRGLDLYSEDPEENPVETNGKNAAIAQANKELRPMLPPASLNGNEVELIKTLNT